MSSPGISVSMFHSYMQKVGVCLLFFFLSERFQQGFSSGL